MYDIKQAQEIVNKALIAANVSKEPAGLYEPIAYALSVGGKRLRPALTIMGCNLFTDSVEGAIDAAIGIEVFHNFTLLHDDIMDNADIRRGNPTVHKKWDENTAILSGDAMMIKASQFVTRTHEEFLKPVLKTFNKAAIQVCEGQQYDMNFENQSFVAEENYLEMIRLKTAVLLAASLKIGAIIGGASNEDAQHLYNFGENLGLAFQLQDDLLDTYGDAKIFGKNIGGDIASNKKTFLLIKALSTAKGDDLAELKDYLQKDDFDRDHKVDTFKRIYDSVNIKETTEDRIKHYFNLANEELNKITVKDEKKTLLKEFCESLMVRTK
ncbi:MAG: polyprenyl synthetase family protein [Bacteroidales bacterium]|jgi:geranylgeranyl diphosphate synthase type II|nr:polyprenyl synthetase family protein [Bacteroidales bacterium]